MHTTITDSSNRFPFHTTATKYKLARMAMIIQASRQFTNFVARLMDDHKGQMEATLIKFYASKISEWVCREAMQIHGGMVDRAGGERHLEQVAVVGTVDHTLCAGPIDLHHSGCGDRKRKVIGHRRRRNGEVVCRRARVAADGGRRGPGHPGLHGPGAVDGA